MGTMKTHKTVYIPISGDKPSVPVTLPAGRVHQDGKIAVLVSSEGFGSGWSTYNDSIKELKEFFLFDAGLVDLALQNASKDALVVYLTKIFGEDAVGVLSIHGWRAIDVHWVPAGSRFFVREYDGLESLVLETDIPWITAGLEGAVHR